MKNISTAIGGAVLAASLAIGTTVQANEGLYVGSSLTGYYLDSERFVGGAEEAVVGGLNLGYRFFNDWALEAGVGTDIGGEDMDTAKLDFYYWLGEANPDSKAWRTYLVSGVNYYDLDDQDPSLTSPYLTDTDDEHSWQLALGIGMSKMISDHFEFRGDVRGLHKIREGQSGVNDAAINLALNYYFNAPKAAPLPVAPTPIPEPEAGPAPEPEMRTISVRLNVEFDFDKATVRNIYGDELEAVANAMKAHDDIDLVLEGHTDSRGGEAYNQNLSDRRAAAVKARMSQQYGIAADRISSVGYGESRPIADNNTDEGRQRNRRVIGELSYTEIME
ncbi:MAG: OmpA family protein [Porticoccaceae bacterium]